MPWPSLRRLKQRGMTNGLSLLCSFRRLKRRCTESRSCLCWTNFCEAPADSFYPSSEGGLLGEGLVIGEGW